MTNKTRAVEARLEIYVRALSAFKRDVGRYPTTEEGLVALISKGSALPNWQGPYLKYGLIPLDSWDQAYIYAFPSQAGSGEYNLYSVGPNGIDEHGFGDDIAVAQGTRSRWRGETLLISLMVVVVTTTLLVWVYWNKGRRLR